MENKYPIIKNLIKEIAKRRDATFQMTGSESICYGVFKTEKTAKAAKKDKIKVS